MPYFEPSRPKPELLTPPKGATSVEMIPSFIPIMPASMASATRAGVRDVILPIDVKPNVEEDLSADQTEGVTIHYATRIEDVLAVALPHTMKESVHDEVLREELIHQAA